MNKATMQMLIHMTDFLGKVLGPDYEIVFHDLGDQEHSVVAICNGHISGRQLDAPLSEKALQVIADKSYKDKEYEINYTGVVADDNRMLRSSSFYIKDELGNLEGMLCVNFDDSRYQAVSDQILKLRHPDAFVENHFFYNKEKAKLESHFGSDAEHFYNSIGAVADKAIAQVLDDIGVPVERLTQEEKQRVVGILDEQGVFLLRGAVKHVARALCSSQATIYRYLSKIKEMKPEE